jgi:hypothetical protein
MIAYEVTGKGKKQKITFTLPEESGWHSRYPQLHIENGVTLSWWDFENGCPPEKLNWDYRKKVLTLPLPRTPDKPSKFIGEPVFEGTADKNYKNIISITIPDLPEAVVLGSISVAPSTIEIIKVAIDSLNADVGRRPSRMCIPENNELFEELLNPRDLIGEAASEKIDQEIKILEAEVESRMASLEHEMASIKEAKSRIVYLAELSKKWNKPIDPIVPFDDELGRIFS